MCSMSVQDILAEKSNGENETEPYVSFVETSLYVFYLYREMYECIICNQ